MSGRSRGFLGLVAAIGVPLIVGGLGAIPTSSAIPTWYRSLKKPAWNPPAWVFGPVWTLLYTLMGTAAWLVWRRGPEREDVRAALGLFGGQLALNGLWSPIFFGLRNPGLALAEIVPLWGVLAATMAQFFRVRPVAGLLLLPYLAWTSFAMTLNAEIWRLNRNK